MTIKVSELAAKVREIATANPDVVYADMYREKYPDADDTLCMYQIDGEPGCLVGQAMFALGLDPELIEGFDADGSEAIGEVLKSYDEFELDDYDDYTFLCVAQTRQDDNKTWGEAINQ